jgi:hypothetical protein
MRLRFISGENGRPGKYPVFKDLQPAARAPALRARWWMIARNIGSLK